MHRRRPTSVTMLWTAAGVVCVIALLSAAGRATDVLTTRHGSGLSAGDSRYLGALSSLFSWERTSPKYRDAATHVVGISEHFRAHPRVTLVHVGAGALLIGLGPLQFSRRLRNKRPAIHRWSGRVLLIAAVAVGLTGLYFGTVVPYAGLSEAAPSAVFGTLFLYTATRAFVAVRRRNFIRHRAWMLRMFALAAGVGTIRVVAVGLLALGMGMRALIGLSFALGWVATLLVAEWWVRRTRHPGGASPATEVA